MVTVKESIDWMMGDRLDQAGGRCRMRNHLHGRSSSFLAVDGGVNIGHSTEQPRSCR